MVIYYQPHLISTHPKSQKPYMAIIAWLVLWVILVLVLS